MCALCGLLGTTHWTEMSATPDAFDTTGSVTLRSERSRRARMASLVLAPLRYKVADFEGTSYRVSSPTGRHEMVDDIQAVWAAVERMRGASLDPLEGAYVAKLRNRSH